MKYLLYISLSFLLVLHSFSLPGKTKKPFIQFKAITLSFDTVQAGVVVKGEFAFKNIGDEMLIIATVQAADGGTVAGWKTEPVRPGEEGIIIVRLNTETRQGYQDKLFNVISNAENNPIMLHWKGVIIGNGQ